MGKRLLLLSALASLAGIGEAQQERPAILQFNPNGPTGDGLIGSNARTNNSNGSTSTYYYYQSAENKRVAAGVWDANGFKSPLRKLSTTEFIHVLHGIITRSGKDGQEFIFKAGDSLLLPRGAEIAWKSTENVREYWVIFDAGAEAGSPSGSSSDPMITRLDPEGPPGKGLMGKGRAKEYEYYSGSDKSSVGVWETAAFTAPGFHTPEYTEFMYFLKGTVTLSTPDGQSRTFHQGDAVLVPRGAAYQWSSDMVRKFWVIFDRQPVSMRDPASSPK